MFLISRKGNYVSHFIDTQADNLILFKNESKKVKGIKIDLRQIHVVSLDMRKGICPGNQYFSARLRLRKEFR